MGCRTAKGAWTDFTGYWQALGQKGISMNVISEVSFQQIRLVVDGVYPRTRRRLRNWNG